MGPGTCYPCHNISSFPFEPSGVESGPVPTIQSICGCLQFLQPGHVSLCWHISSDSTDKSSCPTFGKFWFYPKHLYSKHVFGKKGLLFRKGICLAHLLC